MVSSTDPSRRTWTIRLQPSLMWSVPSGGAAKPSGGQPDCPLGFGAE
jgi:hypothetical protein